MPILATGNRATRDAEAGFSLVELLAVLAILSLMVGAVVMSLPEPRSQTDRVSEAMEAQIDRFLTDGALSGEMRALGPHIGGLVLLRHDGLIWSEAAELAWPDDARIVFEQVGDRTDLPEEPGPLLLFEPYGAVPDFTITLQARDAAYVLGADVQGRIVRSVER